MIERTRINELVTSSCFCTPEGADEFYISLETHEPGSIEKALLRLSENYLHALNKLELSEETLVFCRFYLSDIANQKDALRLSEIFRHMHSGAISVIQQPPCLTESVVLLAYHVRDANRHFEKSFHENVLDPRQSSLSIQGRNYSMEWTSNLTKPGPFDSREQTKDLWRSYAAFAASNHLSVRDNLIRTWIYVRDIDNNYRGMTDARREFFSAQGLIAESRYVASTGIEGKAADARTLVSMDCLAIGAIKEEQILAMNALENMSPTINYGVTFERGLRIKFGDRSHLHVSGTASIDRCGKILHAGNVEKQSYQTLDNIEALLKNQGASTADLSHLLCYVRNAKDHAFVTAILKERLADNLPIIAVQAAVCRPGWLVEMEGVAITPDTNPYPPFF